jgi:hypothetical protein
MNTYSVRSVMLNKRSMIGGLLAGMVLAACPEVGQAGYIAAGKLANGPQSNRATVDSGYDLYQILPSNTSFFGQQFQGVSPYGFYTNRGAGFTWLGNTNTGMIVDRLGKASAAPGGTATTKVQLSYFMLRSTTQMNFMGKGTGYYYLTLQPGKASKGSYTINFNNSGTGGTFSATITLNYEVTKGAHGPVVSKGTVTLTLTNAAWSRTPPPGVALIPGVNQFLSGRMSRLQDFFPVGNMNWTFSGGSLGTSLASAFRM